MNDTWAPNEGEYEAIGKIANSADVGPILEKILTNTALVPAFQIVSVIRTG